MKFLTKIFSYLGGIAILTIVFMILKVVGYLNWSWLWIVSPIWIIVLIIIGSIILFLILLLIFWIAHVIKQTLKWKQ